jgi:UDP-N-acetylmuramoyl-tripeptide--D-alanyl-D-alanine ligase
MMDTRTAAAAVCGRLVGDNVEFLRVVSDSRALQPGDLFVALRGERFDGHDFVAAARSRGAVAAMVAADRADGLAGNLIAVPDTLSALGTLAQFWRRKFPSPLIAVVGSNGKTTVKEMTAAILRAHFGDDQVLATEGNLNNAIGLPLTLLRLGARHRAAVVEIGINHPGETAVLAAIAAPTVGVINNAQREHQEFMHSIAEVAAEHAALLHALPAGGIAVLNADDAHVGMWRDAAAKAGNITVIEFGLDHPAATRARHGAAQTGGVVELATPDGDATVALAARGRHNASNALAAATAALAIGVPLAAVVRGLQGFQPVAGRLVTRTTSTGLTVIDDTYNANPDSVRAAIAVLAAAPSPRWLVLGDMGEVGAEGPAFHREAGREARAAGIDRLCATGTQAAESAAAFGAGGSHFATAEDLARHVLETAAPGTTVLVKGSRFMRMERVVAALDAKAAEGVH